VTNVSYRTLVCVSFIQVDRNQQKLYSIENSTAMCRDILMIAVSVTGIYYWPSYTQCTRARLVAVAGVVVIYSRCVCVFQAIVWCSVRFAAAAE